MATYSGTPKTWTAGETLLASDFNAEIRDPIAALSGAWTSWTPTLSQGASTNIGKTVNRAAYIQVGKLIVVSAAITASATGTSGSAIYLTAPVTGAYTSAHPIGSGWYLDTGTAQYNGAAYLTVSGTQIGLVAGSDTAATFNFVGGNPALAVASGDVYRVFGIYEAA